MNIGSNGKWPVNVLSNFAATPFEIDGVKCNSAEGFIQSLKFPEPEMQKYVCTLVGRKAKFKGKKANKRIRQKQKIWWQGNEFDFRSDEHFALIERGLRAKYTLSDRAKRALLATRNATLTHNTGFKESKHTSLPASKFIAMLYKIRKELQAAK